MEALAELSQVGALPGGAAPKGVPTVYFTAAQVAARAGVIKQTAERWLTYGAREPGMQTRVVHGERVYRYQPEAKIFATGCTKSVDLISVAR
jgi:hypothetical protein